MELTIKPVENRKDLLKFIKSQWLFYRNDPNFVPPLISDKLKTLDTTRNPFFKHSEMQLFLAYNKNEIVGRIASIVNYNHNKTHNDQVGFFGFFECIDEQEVANALFETAEKWLKNKNMTISRGPENPSMNDEIGLLIKGFDQPPLILMTYNPPYYIKLIENAGYKKAKDLYAYKLTYETASSEKIQRLQDIVRERYNVEIYTVNLKNKIQFQKDVADMKYIYNSAWVPNWGFVKWTDEEFDYIANDLKMIANQNLAIFAKAEGKLAGFGLALPNINECLIYNKSGSTLGALWHILTKKKKIQWMRIIALGILPEFQKTGIDAVLYYELANRGHKEGIKFGEASWVLEDNVMMIRGLTQTMNAERYKEYRLYEKEL